MESQVFPKHTLIQVFGVGGMHRKLKDYFKVKIGLAVCSPLLLCGS